MTTAGLFQESLMLLHCWLQLTCSVHGMSMCCQPGLSDSCWDQAQFITCKMCMGSSGVTKSKVFSFSLWAVTCSACWLEALLRALCNGKPWKLTFVSFNNRLLISELRSKPESEPNQTLWQGTMEWVLWDWTINEHIVISEMWKLSLGPKTIVQGSVLELGSLPGY